MFLARLVLESSSSFVSRPYHCMHVSILDQVQCTNVNIVMRSSVWLSVVLAGI